MTPGQAVLRGHRFVSLPAISIIAGFALAGLILLPQLGALFGFLVGVLPAWLWWSWAIPRWRDWLESQGITESSVYRAAISTGLAFPKGNPFEETEFRRKDGSKGWRGAVR